MSGSTHNIHSLLALRMKLIVHMLFETGDHSDVILRFSGQEIKAHKWVLTANSSYFPKALDGAFKEASTNIIELQGDHALALKGLVAMMYGVAAEKHKWFFKNVQDEHYPDNKRPYYLLYLADLYVTASKYLADAAAAAILRVYEASTEEHYTYEADGTRNTYHGTKDTPEDCREWEQLIKHIYITNAEAAVALREPVIGYWAYGGRFGDRSRGAEDQRQVAQDLVRDAPEFAMDLLIAVGLIR